MRFVCALAVRGIEPSLDGSFVLVGVEQHMIVVANPSEPVAVPLFVSLAASPLEAQAGVEHQLVIRVLGPDMDEAAPSLSAQLRLAPHPAAPLGWETKMAVPVAVVFGASQEESYSFELRADDTTVSVPILVRHAPAAGA